MIKFNHKQVEKVIDTALKHGVSDTFELKDENQM